MSDDSEAYVAFDTSKLRNAVAVVETGRAGEVRFLGEIENTEAAVAKLVRKLATKYGRLTSTRGSPCDRPRPWLLPAASADGHQLKHGCVS